MGTGRPISKEVAKVLIIKTHSDFFYVLGHLNRIARNKNSTEVIKIKQIYQSYNEMFGLNILHMIYKKLKPELDYVDIAELNEILKECQELAELYKLPVWNGLRGNEVIENTVNNFTEIDWKNIYWVDYKRRQAGWSEDAPQAEIGYIDEFDDLSQLLTFKIHGAKLNFGKGHLRLWKGDYNNLPGSLGAATGAGGEIGFYNYNGVMIKGIQLQSEIDGLGLVSSTMQLFAINDNHLVAEYSELSGWVTAFSLTESIPRENLYTINTFEFKTETQASSFGAALKTAIDRGARDYRYGEGEMLKADIQGKKVIVTFGFK